MFNRFLNRVASIPKTLRRSRLEQEEMSTSNPHLMIALEENKREGLLLAVRARWVALAVVALMIPFVNPDISVLYYEATLLVFALIGWAQLHWGRVGHNRIELLLVFADLLLLTLITIVPNPLMPDDWPTAMQYRFGNFQYFYVLLAGAVLAFSWRTLLAVGTWTAALSVIGVLIVVFFGHQVPQLSEQMQVTLPNIPRMVEFSDPNSVVPGLRIQEIVVFVIVAAILAVSSWRTNRLILRQACIARERENLSRHFPPNMVERLANQDHPFANIRSQSVAVLFADIVGFTQMAEQNSPEKVVHLLREFHAHMESAVFDHNGTLDKFLGDGVMASFGSPETGPDDAANAISCALIMAEKIDLWNERRAQVGGEPIEIAIGIHYGEVILGDIGSERRMEFATLGDTVNVANRLEELTREIGAKIVISDAVVQANQNKSPDGECVLMDKFHRAGNTQLRGRNRKIDIWALDRAS